MTDTRYTDAATGYEWFREDAVDAAKAEARREALREAVTVAEGFGKKGHLKSRFTKPNGEPVKRMTASEAASHGQWIADCIAKDILALLDAEAPAASRHTDDISAMEHGTGEYDHLIGPAFHEKPAPARTGDLMEDAARHAAANPMPVAVTYTNWRGETSDRRIMPRSVWFGHTEWHPEGQWFVRAWDEDKKAERDFALADFGKPAPEVTVQEAASDIENRVWLKAIEVVSKWRNVHPPGIMFKRLNELMGALDNERRASLRALAGGDDNG